MNEKLNNQPYPFTPRGSDPDAPGGRQSESSAATADEELRALLESWQSPPVVVPASLDLRVINSYRALFSRQKEEEMNLHRTKNLAPPLYALPVSGAAQVEYRITMLEERGLIQRLFAEMSETAHEAELTRAEFRRDPFRFVRRMAAAYGLMLWRTFRQENTAYGVLASFTVALTLAGAIVALGGFRQTREDLLAERVREDIELQSIVTEIPEEQKKPDEGPAGMAKGKGGGAKPKQEKPGGGGGGGRQEAKPASFGKLPPASLEIPQVRAPDPRPPTIKNPSLPVPASIVADPVLFPPDNRQIAYGDPKSKATETSSGPGSGNGIGTGTGGGVGSGEGGGVGPGRGGNTGGGDRRDGGGGAGGGGGGTDYAKTFAAREVTRKATINSKPEPQYTEEARKNQITGTVRLRLVLSASGSVSNIIPQTRLPDGLTEKAIEAARRISFTPAEKDGRKVSQYMTIEYNFNIY
ncbi:MAG: energy transducer TonB [Pyrinomonadaceae bacterium]